MKLFFVKNDGKDRRFIGNADTYMEAASIIDQFCAERNFDVHYVRTWVDSNSNNELVFDVGSWSEFFHWENPNNLTIEELHNL